MVLFTIQHLMVLFTIQNLMVLFTIQNPMEQLPDDLTDRAAALFMATLRYAVEMLTWEQCDSLPATLQPPGELDDRYVCMLFNDEVHTYEQVSGTMKCSTQD